MIKACFIYNPRSGYNISNPQVIERARRFIAEQNAAGTLDARLVSTERPHHATELARAAIAGGCSLIVAIGGDGTINETASALVNTPATLGLIPCGSGNGLGRHLGIRRPDAHAFRTLLHGTPRIIDSGRANEHPFFNVMGLGFDAEVSQRFRSLEKRGFPTYLRIILSEFHRFKPVPCIIKTDTNFAGAGKCGRHGVIETGSNGKTVETGKNDAGAIRGDENKSRPMGRNLIPDSNAVRLDTEAFILAVANSDQYGNDAYIAPAARIDDGLLDLTVIKRVTPLNALPLGLRLLTRRLHGSRAVAHLRATGFVIERPSAGLIHTDGEPRETGARIEIKILPGSLRVMAAR